jgi:cholesterol transport system auxiliary component
MKTPIRVMAEVHAEPARRALLMAGLVASPVLLAGCLETLLPRPAALPQRYGLDNGVRVPRVAASLAGAPSLVVDLPRAAAGYDGRRMIYMRQAPRLEAFAFHEWLDTPAQMLVPLLVAALQGEAAFGVVLRAPTAAVADWRLETELLRLHQDFTQGPSRIRLTLRAVLLHAATRRAVAWREFDLDAVAAADNPESGVFAAQLVARRLAQEVAVFCASQVRIEDGSAR